MVDDSTEISRWDIYTPVSRSEMQAEATSLIDPSNVKPIKPSWKDGTVYPFNPWDDSLSEYIYLSEKIRRFSHSIYPTGLGESDPNFDDRLYFAYPLVHARRKYPIEATLDSPSTDSGADNKGMEQGASFAEGGSSSSELSGFEFTRHVSLSHVMSADDSESLARKQLRNLGYDEDAINHFIADHPELKTATDEKIIEAIDVFHRNPVGGEGAIANNAAVAAVAPDDAWYNNPPKKKVPFMGISDDALSNYGNMSISHTDWQQYLTAANKRLVKVWMGELKYVLSERNHTEEQARTLENWFGTEDGRAHFRGWCEKLGKQGGDRKPSGKGAHAKGKAMDINYEFNPWCPVAQTHNHDGIELNRYSMKGEKKYISYFDNCARVYERALRVFVPFPQDTEFSQTSTSSETDDSKLPSIDVARRDVSKYYAMRYYRNHYDWTIEQAMSEHPPFTARQVHLFHTVLNWSLRFYFDYRYESMKNRKNLDESKNSFKDDNLRAESHENGGVTGTVIWDKIDNDISELGLFGTCLPSTSHILLDESSFSTGAEDFSSHIKHLVAVGILKEVAVHFAFNHHTTTDNYLSLPLTNDNLSSVNKEQSQNADIKKILGTVVSEQIKADHLRLSRGMVYSSISSTRDPCNGVFNFGFDMFMALCYMLSGGERSWFRGFGSFAPGAGGDFQHFDYRFRQR